MSGKNVTTSILKSLTPLDGLKAENLQALVKKTTNELKQDTKLVSALRKAVDASSDESGWAQLGPVGSHVANQSSNFDPRNYGYEKLGELVKATKLFDIEERSIGNDPMAIRN